MAVLEDWAEILLIGVRFWLDELSAANVEYFLEI
jgi:hypothetical protein